MQGFLNLFFDKLRCTSANEQALCFRFAVILHIADFALQTCPNLGIVQASLVSALGLDRLSNALLRPSFAQQSAKNKLQNRLNLINRTTLHNAI